MIEVQYKTKEEIEKIKEAGKIVREALEKASDMTKPGIRTIEIDQEIEKIFNKYNAIPIFKGYKIPWVEDVDHPFPNASCISINQEICHGIPGDREIVPGDLVKLDTACSLDGWCADSAVTIFVPMKSPTSIEMRVRNPDKKGPKWIMKSIQYDGQDKKKLVVVGDAVLHMAIQSLNTAVSWDVVASKIQKYAENVNFEIVREFSGHGIGRTLHEMPRHVLNYSNKETRKNDFFIKEGLVIAIEPVMVAGKRNVAHKYKGSWEIVTQDKSPGVHFEHTVAISHNGPVILT